MKTQRKDKIVTLIQELVWTTGTSRNKDGDTLNKNFLEIGFRQESSQGSIVFETV